MYNLPGYNPFQGPMGPSMPIFYPPPVEEMDKTLKKLWIKQLKKLIAEAEEHNKKAKDKQHEVKKEEKKKASIPLPHAVLLFLVLGLPIGLIELALGALAFKWIAGLMH